MDENNYSDGLLYSRKRRKLRKIISILRAYSFMGILIALLGVGYFVSTLLPGELSTQQKMSLVVVGTGIVLAIMSRAAIILWKEREEEKRESFKEYERMSDFLNTWARFEMESKKALKNEGEDLNRHSLRSIISRLHEEGKIDKTDVMALEDVLQARNSFVHGGRPLSATYAEKITDILIEIIKKIATDRRRLND
jgi:hypothetical protein